MLFNVSRENSIFLHETLKNMGRPGYEASIIVLACQSTCTSKSLVAIHTYHDLEWLDHLSIGPLL